MSSKKTAAFFRLEGTLLKQGVLDLAAYMAANSHGFVERAVRLGQVAVAAPFYGYLGKNDRNLATRIAYVPLRGMSEDRVAILTEEYVANVLSGKLLQKGVSLIEKAREAGHEITLISDCIREIAEPIAREIGGVDTLICNELEFRNGVATGSLVSPVIGGHQLGPWISDHANKNNIDLNQSTAYATHGPDLLLLAAVGNPCAVNPDFSLRRAAHEARWPVMEFTA